MGNVWRLIIHGELSPRLNMDIDEALLQAHTRGECPPTLRFYRWSPPAVSLGYFQKKDGISPKALEEMGIEVVRRSTGGRAVLHWGDLTYSIVARAGKDTPIDLLESYKYLCQGLLAGMSLLGVEAFLGSEKPSSPFPGSCFAVSTPGDITWRGKKFIGSAQKRVGDFLLQHGSILLKPQGDLLTRIFSGEKGSGSASLKEKVTSIEEILGEPVTPEKVICAVMAGFERALGISFGSEM
ncbi:MAG: lipoate--protein ligase family protein [Bacillota bacterium]